MSNLNKAFTQISNSEEAFNLISREIEKKMLQAVRLVKRNRISEAYKLFSKATSLLWEPDSFSDEDRKRFLDSRPNIKACMDKAHCSQWEESTMRNIEAFYGDLLPKKKKKKTN